MSIAYVSNETAKPTGRQVYKACALALAALGVEFPRTRGEASELIGRLQSIATESAVSAAAAHDDIPF